MKKTFFIIAISLLAISSIFFISKKDPAESDQSISLGISDHSISLGIDSLKCVTIGYEKDVWVYGTLSDGVHVEDWLNRPHDEIMITDSSSLVFFEKWKKKVEEVKTSDYSSYSSGTMNVVIYNYKYHSDTLCMWVEPCRVELNHRMTLDSSYFFMINSFLYQNDSTWRSNNGWLYKKESGRQCCPGWNLIETPKGLYSRRKTEEIFTDDQIIDYEAFLKDLQNEKALEE